MLKRSDFGYLVTLESTRTCTPSLPGILANTFSECNCLSKRDPPKSRLEPIRIRRSFQSPASLCRPRFSFFAIQLSKIRREITSRAPSPSASALRGSLYAARLNFVQLADHKSEALRRQQRRRRRW